MKIQLTDGGDALFDCPGCGQLHIVYLNTLGRPHWTYNGAPAAPTFRPSIAVHWTEFDQPKVCHSFVTEGKIEFCGDSTHPFAGKTLELPEWEE
jgi:hypothetical protein